MNPAFLTFTVFSTTWPIQGTYTCALHLIQCRRCSVNLWIFLEVHTAWLAFHYSALHSKWCFRSYEFQSIFELVEKSLARTSELLRYHFVYYRAHLTCWSYDPDHQVLELFCYPVREMTEARRGGIPLSCPCAEYRPHLHPKSLNCSFLKLKKASNKHVTNKHQTVLRRNGNNLPLFFNEEYCNHNDDYDADNNEADSSNHYPCNSTYKWVKQTTA